MRVTAKALRVACRILPQLPFALQKNKAVTKHFAASRTTRHAGAVEELVAAPQPEIDLGAAIALWESETSRLAGIVSKASGVLAADALVAAGIAQLSPEDGWVGGLNVAAVIYLLSAVMAAAYVQMPQPRHVVSADDVRDGRSSRRMLEVVDLNIPGGIRTQNLVSSSVDDTLVALILFLLAMVISLLST